jgi:hypothetical protein
MAHNRCSPGIVTGPLPDPDGLWLDLVFEMNILNGAMRQFGAMIDGIQRHVSGKIHHPGAVERSDLT